LTLQACSLQGGDSRGCWAGQVAQLRGVGAEAATVAAASALGRRGTRRRRAPHTPGSLSAVRTARPGQRVEANPAVHGPCTANCRMERRGGRGAASGPFPRPRGWARRERFVRAASASAAACTAAVCASGGSCAYFARGGPGWTRGREPAQRERVGGQRLADELEGDAAAGVVWPKRRLRFQASGLGA